MSPVSAPTLADLSAKYGSDKHSAHSYVQWYEEHFERFRGRPIRLLEIGIGGYDDPTVGGGSLRMWKEFFPHAEIVGLDIHPKPGIAEDRITALQGDQGDGDFLQDLSRRYGPFDIVIDDGSHRSEHIIASFRALFPLLADGGVYAIEDLQTSYWRVYNDQQAKSPTSMEFIKGLVDGLNYAEYDVPNYEPSYSDRWVKGVAAYHNLAFILKGANDEPSNILPPHPRRARLKHREGPRWWRVAASRAFHLLPGNLQVRLKELGRRPGR